LRVVPDEVLRCGRSRSMQANGDQVELADETVRHRRSAEAAAP
jgi:hypothetical protein